MRTSSFAASSGELRVVLACLMASRTLLVCVVGLALAVTAHAQCSSSISCQACIDQSTCGTLASGGGAAWRCLVQCRGMAHGHVYACAAVSPLPVPGVDARVLSVTV